MINHIIFDWQGVIEKIGGTNKELLDWIKKNKDQYSFSVLTNSPANFNKKLKKLEIENLFETVVNPREGFVRKPEPKAYKTLLERVDKKPDECLFIDDSATNIQAAKNIGIKSVIYTDNPNLFKKLNNLNI